MMVHPFLDQVTREERAAPAMHDIDGAYRKSGVYAIALRKRLRHRTRRSLRVFLAGASPFFTG